MVFKRVRNYKTKYQVFVGKKSKTVTTKTPYLLNKTSTPQKILSSLTGVSEVLDQDEKLVNLASSSKDQSEDLSSQQTLNQKVYSSAKINRLDNWTQLRQSFLETAVEMESPNTQQCCLCGLEDTDLYRCIDCSSWLHMCLECLRNRHSLPHLHMFEKWMNGTHVSYKEDSPVWKTTHACSKSYCKEMVILDERGRQHLRQVQLCSCEPEAVSLLRMDLWAASPKQPKMAFQIELLKWLNGLLLHCHVSVSSFVDALNARISKRHSPFMGQCSGVYQVLMKECVQEYRHFSYMLENGQHISENLDKGTTCPACFLSSTKIMSFDADFQLVRKFSGGHAWTQPRHIDSFFLDQSSVDSFMSCYSGDVKEAGQECSNFQAGSDLRSKVKNAKLSETALFGSVCRHGFPYKFFSLKHGERLGYSVFLLEKLIEENTESNIHVMYDIGCILVNHLKKNKPDILQKVTFSIPIFHCYGHKFACQILYNPRRVAGLGLTDGEGTERLWSYLGKFKSITKEMTPENRIDLLSDGLEYYGRKIKNKLGQSLVKKMEKTVSLKESSKLELDELMSSFEGVNEDSILQWIEDEKCTAKELLRTRKKETLGEMEEYCVHLDNYYKLRKLERIATVEKELKQEEDYLKRKERLLKMHRPPEESAILKEHLISAQDFLKEKQLEKVKSCVDERSYLVQLMRKYARGQSMAIRISNNIKKVMVKLKLQIKLYNNLKGWSLKYPNTLDFETVKEQEAPIWKDQMNNISEVADVPTSIKHQCIELLSTLARCKEEQGLIEEEMSSFIAWLLNEYNHLNDLVEQSELTSAKRSVVIKEAMIIETDLNMLNTLFKTYIGLSEVPCTYCSYVFGTENELCKILEECKETEEIFLEESDSELESETESDVDESEDEDS